MSQSALRLNQATLSNSSHSPVLTECITCCYGCDQPAYNGDFWRGGATCGGSTHILFSIGNEGDPVQYLVLQIHYAKPFEGNVRDFSGVTLHLSDNRPKYVAAVYLFVSGQPIPPRQAASLNNMSCSYNSETELHPFAFRTHTHAMGRVRNPQWPQLFQSSPIKVVIKKGDFMAATCRFDSSDKDVSTPMGSMGVDEMCNFYMMFYRDVNAADPFPYGAGCGMNEKPELVAKEYPMEGSTLLPAHPEWEHMAHQSGKPFGVVEKEKISSIGDEKLGQITAITITHRRWHHQVIKWQIQNDELTPVWELGTKFQPDQTATISANQLEWLFSRADGTVYVADGYCNTDHEVLQRRAVLAGVGSCLSTPEGRCSKFGSRLLLLPTIFRWMRRNSKVYVADRENGRVQVFSDKEIQCLKYAIQNCLNQFTRLIFVMNMAYSSYLAPSTKSMLYVVPLNSTKIQFSFRPKSDQFRRPHIIRAKGNTVYVGEIDEAGGILWSLDIQAEKTQRS
uniref:Copper type II ascorbate-dependent monooxygenase C-terminal domain-containing protein n=1 Tax=Ditylenchus dipsaci TaxID=166011 RepID=A0A915E6I2_9BILA